MFAFCPKDLAKCKIFGQRTLFASSRTFTIFLQRATPPQGSGLPILMAQVIDVNPTSEHGIYLQLFITTSGGW